MVAPQFIGINATGELDLQSLIPTGDNYESEDTIVIDTLNYHGGTEDSYVWINWGGDDIGWMIDYSMVDGVTFTPGQGLWVTGTSVEDGLQSSGEVGKDDVLVQLRFGATGTGNPFPVALDLQDIVPVGDNYESEDTIVIDTLNYHGGTEDSYVWINWGGDDIGWMIDYSLVEDVTFDPGAGLWVTGTSTEDYIRIPAPEL